MDYEYTLYLDESKYFDKEKNAFYYAVAGVIVEKDDEKSLKRDIENLKYKVWGDRKVAQRVVLHEAEIRSNNRNILNRKPEYERLIGSSTNKATLIHGVGNLINKYQLTVLGAIVDQQSIQTTYNISLMNDSVSSYKIALVQIIENFTLFLKLYDAKGKIVIESRKSLDKDIQDQRLRKVYTKTLAHGTQIYSGTDIQNRLVGIEFISKHENNIGLQIADFIPRPIILSQVGAEQSKPSIYKTAIRNHRFNAYQKEGGMRIFGIKLIK